MKNKFAFTLAEVLITLVIIGVVAALTISAVVNTYVERSTVAKVKKGLSILAQAKKLAEAQNGSIIGWDFDEGQSITTNSQFFNHLRPYISLAKDCGSHSGCYQISPYVYQLSGGSWINYNTDSNYYKFILSDGSVMWFRTGGNNGEGKCSVPESDIENGCAVFYYDVNGSKSPNTIGKDIFAYVINIDGVYPYIRDDCNKNSRGWGCTSYIIKNDNMNYLH